MAASAPSPSVHIPFEDHPMCDESSIIATDALEQAINAIIQLLRGRQTGLAIYATPRTGKTHMIDYFIRHHPAFLNQKIPCFNFRMWNTKGLPRTTRASFFADFLRIFDYADYKQGNAVAKFGTTIELMKSAIDIHKERRALLFVDEAQNLRREEYGFLMDLYNDLRADSIRLKTVLVGQPSLQSDQKELRGCKQIKARFMPRWLHMRGVYDKDHLDRILRAIDDETEFPENSGCTYTSFFVPNAFEGGFKLRNQLGPLWDALKNARRECNLGESNDFTMQTIMEFLTDVLREIAHTDSPDLVTGDAVLREFARLAVQGQIDDELETVQ